MEGPVSPNQLVQLGPDDGRPLYLRIAHALIVEIRRGRLRPGRRLPGTRRLAQALSVNRNTVVAAYDELAAEGWVVTAAASGTRVAADLPDVPTRGFGATAAPLPGRQSPGFTIPPSPEEEPFEAMTPRPGELLFSGGVPDLRLVPAEALARAWRRGLRLAGRTLLNYGDPAGLRRLRETVARMVADERGVTATAEQVMIVRGSQMGLFLAGQALLRSGDRVVVEALGYPPAWTSLRFAGVDLVPAPVDAAGLDVDALERILADGPIRAVYLTPHHQFPTMVALAPARRLRLLELARRHRFALIEDDYDHEVHFRGHPFRPLASADTHGVVVYIGTLSKVLAPGLRLGYVVAPTEVIERMTMHRRFVDRQGDQALEWAVTELIDDGEVQRHTRRMRRVYAARREALADAIAEHLAGVVSFDLPPGGLALWARVAPDVDIAAWAAAGRDHLVGIASGRLYSFDGSDPQAIRLGYASLAPEEIHEATRRLAKALPSCP